MATTSIPDRTFVVVAGFDLGDPTSSDNALERAARLVARMPGSELHVVHVRKPDAEDANLAAAAVRRIVTERGRQLGVPARRTVGVHVRTGEPAKEIAQLASDVGADLVVLGTHKPLRQLLTGSTAQHVMASTTIPVVVAGPQPARRESTPAIEPPCPECVERRFETRGQSWWCARHSERHPRAHVYSYQEEMPFGMHDSEVIPTGTD